MKAWPHPAPAGDGAANHLVAGLALPSVTLVSTDGGVVNLGAAPGLVVVFVYPWTGRPGLPNPPRWDDIPGAHGSTPEAEGFRDCYAGLQVRGFDVFGLSGQSSPDQKAFVMRAGLPFQLLSDAGLAFADALRLPRFETGGVIYLKRLTLIVRDGVIYRSFYPVHPPHTHAQDILEQLSQVQP